MKQKTITDRATYNVSAVRESKRRKRVVIRTPNDVGRLVWAQVTRPGQEQMFAVVVNVKNEVLALELMTLGTTSAAIAHPTQAFKVYLENADRGACGIILVHNHPGGGTLPSREDIQFTRRMQVASWVRGIELLDHVIVASDDAGGFNLHSIRGSGNDEDWMSQEQLDKASDWIWSS